MNEVNVRDEVKQLVEELPEDASWDDLMERIYIRQAIESGLRDSEMGRTVEVHEVRARFNLDQ